MVSVIIPAYNAELFISKTLDSILLQSWKSWEIIVVNDGSKDNTESIVKSYADRDDRIILINQQNSGCSSAKNTGLYAAKGDYIQYLDADDLLSNNKLEEQVKAISSNRMHIAVCPTIIFNNTIDEQGIKELDTEFLASTDNMIEFLLNLYGLNGRAGMIQPNAFLISKELAHQIGDWDISISPSPDEDGEYFCRAMLRAGKIIYTPNCCNYYRKLKGSNSLSKQVSHLHAAGALRSLKLKLDHILVVENSVRVKRVFVNQFAEFIYNYYPFYPDLCQSAEGFIHDLGFVRIPATGGKYFKILAKLIGFKSALKLRNYLFSLKQRIK